jgi:hypothetical protein
MEDVYSSRPTRIRLMEIYFADVFRKWVSQNNYLKKKIQLPYDHDQDGSLKESL